MILTKAKGKKGRKNCEISEEEEKKIVKKLSKRCQKIVKNCQKVFKKVL
jgi:hypothetical protein